MESTNINTDNSEEIDDCLEKVVQDFTDFQAKILGSSSSHAMNFEEIIDLYISRGEENSYGTSNSKTDTHIVESTDIHSRNGLDMNKEIQESEIMITEMTEEIGDGQNLHDTTDDVNIDLNMILGVSSQGGENFEENFDLNISHGRVNFEEIVDFNTSHGQVNPNGTSNSTMDQFTTLLPDFNIVPPATHLSANANDLNINKAIQETEMMIKKMAEGKRPVTYIRYGDMNRRGAGGGEISSLFGACSSMVIGPVQRNSTITDGARNLGFGENRKAEISTPGNRKRRKYRGAVETEEEAAQRLERTKMNNRISAAKAHADRQAREVRLQMQLLKLRKKNEFLKNLFRFWKGEEKDNLPSEPLRRTKSGP